jgi:hypothetical protein
MRAPHATANCLSEIPQLLFLLYAMRDAPCAIRAPHTRASCSRRLRRHVPFMYSLASNSFSRFALTRDGCAAPIARERRAFQLPKLMPIAPMSICTNLGLNQSSRLGANAGYVVLHARLLAHECELAIANEHD